MCTGKLFCQSIYNDLWRPTRVLAGEEFFRNEDVSWKISSKMFSRKRRRHPVKKTWVSEMRANCASASYQASYLQYTIQLHMLHLHTGFIPSFILAVYNTIIHASSSYRLHSARLLTPGFMFNPLPPNAADIYTENGGTVHFRSVRESTAYISNRDPASLGCFFGTELSCPPRLRFCLRGIRKDVFLPPWCKTICRTISLSSADNNSV